MLHKKDELLKIVVNCAEDFAPYHGKDISDRHIIMNCADTGCVPAAVEGCVIEGGTLTCRKLSRTKLINMESVSADELHLCMFLSCRKVQCGDYDEGYKAEACQFFHCSEISINYAAVEDCIFNDFEILFLTGTCIHNCLFSEITCNNDCAISMEDGEISESCFEHIKLLNDSYLIDGIGDAYVNESVFADIRTERDDREIFRMEEERGFIIKKTKEFSFVDEDTCRGLDLITDLDGNIDMTRFAGV